MAKCKLCKTNIPDETEYCKDCLEKKRTNETYLDSLLNSVKNTAPTAESIYQRKNNSNKSNVEPDLNNDMNNEPDVNSKQELNHEYDDYDMYGIDPNDIEDFDQFNFEEDLNDINKDVIIGEEELFGEKLSSIYDEKNKVEQENLDFDTDVIALMETAINQELAEESTADESTADESTLDESTLEKSTLEESTLEDINTQKINNLIQEEEETPVTETLLNNVSTNEILSFQDDDNIDEDINNLLNSLDFATNQKDDIRNEDEHITSQEILPDGSIIEKSTSDDIMQEENPDALEDLLSDAEGIEPSTDNEFEQMEEDDEFLSLLNQMSSDDPVSEDVMAINDLLNGVAATPKNKANNVPSDVGEVFSDALKVVSSLDDPNFDEAELLNQISDKKGKKGKNNKKVKKKKKQKKEQDLANAEELPKKGLFQRLFGNIEDAEGSKNAKKAASANGGESKEVQKSTKKKAGKKAKNAISQEDNEEASDDKKPTKDKSKKSLKKDKEEKKKKTKEIIQVIDEIEENEGKINRLGASIVFLFFGLLVLLLLAGTNVISYSLSIQNATNYFEKQKYTQAYNEVYGIEIKDEDIEIYDKIMTVMFVNKQLNSYNNYYSMEKYPEALDSLLKGLKRYDKYIELATMLGIKTDLDYVRNQILAELENVFNLSEKDAFQMLNYDSMEAYSLEVYDVVLEKMNN